VEKYLMAATIQPDRILRELSELWVGFGKQDGEQSTGVLRACAMTLVVVADAREDANDVSETLALLMRDHPSRAIVVRVDDTQKPQLDSRVFAQCWMPLGHRRQICCEQIEITSSNISLADVPSVLLPLAVADLPVIVWSRIPRLFGSPSLGDISRMAAKTIVDSAAFPAAPRPLGRLAASSGAGLVLGDLAWTRCTRWRELIAQIFENPDYARHLPEIASVAISHPGAEPTMGVRYMAAWLLLCLERCGSRPKVRWESGRDLADAGLGRIEFATADPSHLTASVQKLEGAVAEVRVNAVTSRTVFPEASDYELLREELSIGGRDPIFDSTLARAAAVESR
jgi:glucose-6-phosphate dehydrogenase assembly protein OpcA